MSIEAILKRIKDEQIEYVDIQFGDMFGRLHHVTFIAKNLDEEKLAEGLPFDGSSIRAWRSIEKSDMLFVPDPSTAFIDPFRTRKTMILFGDIVEPVTGEMYERAPRNIAKKAVEFLRSTGIGDSIFFGPEPEFFIFDRVAYDIKSNTAFFEVDHSEGPWNTGGSQYEEIQHGHPVFPKEGYLPVTPQDSLMDIRSEITSNMQDMGLTVFLHHHEVATAQGEVGIKYDTATYSGDNVHKYKYATKNTATQFGKTATFMPKPLADDNGSGMHVHSSIWKNGKNLFAGDKYANLSQEALYAIGGLLKHGRSIQVFTNPTVNSYRRLVPGYEAPVRLAYSSTNRSAAVRIPYVHSDIARRIEFRCCDSSGSPYLCFAAMTMAMIDGIRNQIEPGDALEKNIYDLPPEELQNIPSTCASLESAFEELESDLDYLNAGDVFTQDFIGSYREHKMTEEIEPNKLLPTPLEYKLYYST